MLDAMLLALMISTCNDRAFVNVGNNVGVPMISVLKYAQDHGLAFDEARYLIGIKQSKSVGRAGESLKIVADEKGVKVASTELQASATRFSFDESKRILVLEGTDKRPATLVKNGGGRAQLSGRRITYWLNDARFKVEGTRR